MSIRLGAAWALVVSMATSLCPGAAAGADSEIKTAEPAPDLDLTAFTERLDALRSEQHIPALGVALVKDGAVVFAGAFGDANVEAQVQATPDTIFAVGSTTKAFTAALIALLAEEGRLAWDDPVAEHLPYFELAVDSDEPGAAATLRDLMCHRTGFAFMDVLWAGGGASREEVLRAAATARPVAKFRSTYSYNNVMVLAAGEAAAKVAGSTWDDLVSKRFFEPLGMTSTSTSITVAQRDPRLATGYTWDAAKGTLEATPMRNLDGIAAAGAINSTARDMAQWVRFQLGRGTIDGKTLMRCEAIEGTWEPQIPMEGDALYALGWGVSAWNGKRVVSHTGGIDGFGALVVLFPDDGAGAVFLANRAGPPLFGAAPALVGEALLSAPQASGEGARAQTPAELTPYLGTYIANFGPFKDVDFTVQVKEEGLAIDVPGQMVYDLEPPDTDGWWAFRGFAISASFDRNESGDVVRMRMMQAGQEYVMPKRGAALATDYPADLARYVGEYRSAEMGMTTTVLIKDGRLAIDVPGQTVYDLDPPGTDGRWAFSAMPAITIEFPQVADGALATESLTLHQSGMSFVMPRVGGAAVAGVEPITVEALHALRRSDEAGRAIDAISPFRMTASVRLVNAGLDGTITWTFTNAAHHRTEVDFGPFGREDLVVDGAHAEKTSSFQARIELDGRLLDEARLSHPAAIFGDLRAYFDPIRVVGAEELDGRLAYIVELGRGAAPPSKSWVDTEHGDIVRSVASLSIPGGGEIPITMTLDDYRSVHGARVPFRMVSESPGVGEIVTIVTGLEPVSAE